MSDASGPTSASPALRVCARFVDWPRATLAGVLLVSTLLGLGTLRLGFDPSAEAVFPDGHWAVTTFQAFREAFGSDEAIFVALEVEEGDVFSPQALAAGRDLARRLERIEGVERAFSLADVPVLTRHPLLGPTLGPGLPDDLASVEPDALAAWRAGVLRTPYVDRLLVSQDRRATTVVATLETLDTGVAGAARNKAIVEQVQAEVAAAQGQGRDLYAAGSPMIKARIMDAVLADLMTFALPLALIALAAAGVMLRSLRGMLLVLAVLVVSVDLTLGAMGHLGIPLDPMSTQIPALLLVIGVADSLHLLVEQRAQAARLGPGATGAETIVAALGNTFVPCLLTSVTTAIGFGSLVTSDIPPIRHFGVAAALSALVAFLVTMVLIPAAAALMRAPQPHQDRAARADRLADFVTRRPWAGLLVGVALTAAGIFGWLRVVPDTNFLTFFPEDDPLVSAARRIEARFVGIAPCELLVAAPPGAHTDPRVLQALWDFERELERDPVVDLAFSVADCVAAARALVTGVPGVPETREEVQRLEHLLTRLTAGEMPVEQLIHPPGPLHPEVEWLRVSVRAHAVGSQRMSQLIDRVHELERAHLTPVGVTVTPTGTSIVFSQTADRIMSGQIESFGWAFGCITLVVALALRSPWLGLLSILPNLLPVAVLLGAMGLLGIPLNSFNSVVASIAIGIAIDDTIHVLACYRRFARDLPPREAVHAAVAHVGPAVIATSTVLFAGFAVLLLATFKPTAHFGGLTAIAIVAALLGDLLMLPALLLLFASRRAPAPAESGGPEPSAPRE